MEEPEKLIIRKYAAGDKSLRDQALYIYRRYNYPRTPYRETPEMGFMSEVDNVSPCWVMREHYKEKLTKLLEQAT